MSLAGYDEGIDCPMEKSTKGYGEKKTEVADYWGVAIGSGIIGGMVG